MLDIPYGHDCKRESYRQSKLRGSLGPTSKSNRASIAASNSGPSPPPGVPVLRTLQRHLLSHLFPKCHTSRTHSDTLGSPPPSPVSKPTYRRRPLKIKGSPYIKNQAIQRQTNPDPPQIKQPSALSPHRKTGSIPIRYQQNKIA